MSGRHPAPPTASRAHFHPNYPGSKLVGRYFYKTWTCFGVGFFFVWCWTSHTFFFLKTLVVKWICGGFINTLPIRLAVGLPVWWHVGFLARRVNELQRSLKNKKTLSLTGSKHKNPFQRCDNCVLSPSQECQWPVLYLLKFTQLSIATLTFCPPRQHGPNDIIQPRCSINHAGCIPASLSTIRLSALSFSPRTERRRGNIRRASVRKYTELHAVSGRCSTCYRAESSLVMHLFYLWLSATHRQLFHHCLVFRRCKLLRAYTTLSRRGYFEFAQMASGKKLNSLCAVVFTKWVKFVLRTCFGKVWSIRKTAWIL